MASGMSPLVSRDWLAARAGDAALVRQAPGAGTVVQIESLEFLVGEFLGLVVGVGADEGGEGRLVHLRHQVAVHGGHAHGGGAQTFEKGVQALLGTLPLVLAPETQEEGGALAIGEALEVARAQRVLVVLQQRRAVVGAVVGAVAHQVAQQADERQVDRLLQGHAQGGDARVVLALEVAEAVRAAAGEEGFVGAGRVLALQRRLQGIAQVLLGLGDQLVEHPAAQVVLRRHLDLAQRLGTLPGIAAVQLGDHLQVGGQHP